MNYMKSLYYIFLIAILFAACSNNNLRLKPNSNKPNTSNQIYNSFCCKCDSQINLLLKDKVYCAFINLICYNKSIITSPKLLKVDSDFIKIIIIQYKTDSIFNAPCSDIFLTNAIIIDSFYPKQVYYSAKIENADTLYISLTGSFISNRTKMEKYFEFMNRREVIGHCRE